MSSTRRNALDQSSSRLSCAASPLLLTPSADASTPTPPLPVGSVLARSLIRLLIRSDTLQPVIYCDALFLNPSGTSAFSAAQLTEQIQAQATALAAHMRIPVVHAGCTLPAAPIAGAPPAASGDGAAHIGDATSGQSGGKGVRDGVGYVREVRQLGYHVYWVDLLEIDGVSPYTYSEVRTLQLLSCEIHAQHLSLQNTCVISIAIAQGLIFFRRCFQLPAPVNVLKFVLAVRFAAMQRLLFA